MKRSLRTGRPRLGLAALCAPLALASVLAAPWALAGDLPEPSPYGWTISASSTDPYQNTAAATSGLRTVYLWFACNSFEPGGMSWATFTIEAKGAQHLATLPVNGFRNDGTMDDVLLVAEECRQAPVVAAQLVIVDSEGSLCLGESSRKGGMQTADCSEVPQVWPMAWIGYDNTGGPPCGEGILACQPATGGHSLCPRDVTVGPADPQLDVLVPMDLTGMPPFDEFGFDVDYDETKLVFVEARRSKFTRDCTNDGDPGCFDSFRFFPDVPSPGTVRIGGFSGSGNETPGFTEVLCTLVFRPLNASVTNAELTAVRFYDDLKGAAPCTGEITFAPNVPALDADAGPDKEIDEGGSVVIGAFPVATGGVPPYTYRWSPQRGLNNPNLENPTASPDVTTGYTVTVTDASGQQATDLMRVIVFPLGAGTICPSPLVCVEGLEFSVPIVMEGVPPFSGFGFDLDYDDVLLDLVDVRRSEFTRECPNPGDPNCFDSFRFFPNVPSTGMLRIGGFSSSGDETPAATEILCEVVFRRVNTSVTSTVITASNFVDDFNGIKSCARTVQLVAPPTASAGPDIEITDGTVDSVRIGGNPTATGGTPGYTFLWSPTAGLSDPTAANPNALPGSDTFYTVTVTDAAGCQDTDTMFLNLVPNGPLRADAGPDTTVCGIDSVRIGGNPSARGGVPTYTYQWSPQAGLDDPTSPNPMAAPSVTRVYTLTVTDQAGTQATDQVRVRVLPGPTADAGPERTIPRGESVQIGGSPTASGGQEPYTFVWEPGLGLDDPFIANPTASPFDTTTYKVTVTDANGCRDMDSVTVNVVGPDGAPLVANAGPDREICDGDSIFIGGSPTASGGVPPYSIAWSPSFRIDDPTSPNPIAFPTSTTTYRVTVTDSRGDTDTDTMRLTVNPNPVANAGIDRKIALGDTVLIGATPPATDGTPPYTCEWSPTRGLDDPTFCRPNASPEGTTVYTLTVTDAKGCTSTDTMILEVDNGLKANAGEDRTICSGETTVLGSDPTAAGGTPPYTITWSPPDGLDDPSSPNPNASPAVTTMYTVVVQDAAGGVQADQVWVFVNPSPTANAGPDKNIEPGGSATIGSNPPATGGTLPYTCRWTPAAGLDDPLACQPTASPPTTRVYTLTVTDANGCRDTDQVRVNVGDPDEVIADAGPDASVCRGGSVTIGGNPTGGGGVGLLSFSWNPTAGLDDPTSPNPIATPIATTTYTVTVTDAVGQSDSDPMTLTVHPNPVANAGPDWKLDLGDEVLIGVTPPATGGTPPYTCVWSPSSGLDDSTFCRPIASPTTTTVYTLTVTDANGCQDTDTMVLEIDNLLKANAGENRTICAGETTTLGSDPTAAGGTPPYTISWTPTNGLDDPSSPNPNATPTVTTSYVVLVQDSAGASRSDTVVVTVNPSPDANAGPDRNIARGGSVTIGAIPPATGGTPPYTCRWIPAAGLDDPTLCQPTASPEETTTYTLTVTDANGCMGTDAMRVIVDGDPGDVRADAGDDLAICAGGSVEIGGDPTGAGGTPPYTFSWTPATGLDDPTSPNPIASPSSSTTYMVTVTDAQGTFDTDSMRLTVNENPQADAGPDRERASDGPAVLLGASPPAIGGTPPYTCSWSPERGLDDPTFCRPLASPSQTTVYTLTVTDANGCVGVDAMTLVVDDDLKANAGPDTAICAGDSVTIGGTPTGAGGDPPYTFSWVPTTGLDDPTTSNPMAFPTSTTTYTVTVTDDSGVSESSSVTITVHPTPVANAGPNRAIALGESVTIGATQPATGGTPPYECRWSPALGLDDPTECRPLATPSATTTYTLTVTDANGCRDTDTMVVTVQGGLAANAGPDREICEGASVTIGGDPTAIGGTPPYSFSWDPRSGLSDPDVANPEASPSSSRTYTVTVTDDQGFTAMDSMVLTVNENPRARAGSDRSISAGETVELGGSPSATGGEPPYEFRWEPPIGLDDPSAPNPMATPSSTTTYVLTVTDANGCSDTDEIRVTVDGDDQPPSGCGVCPADTDAFLNLGDEVLVPIVIGDDDSDTDGDDFARDDDSDTDTDGENSGCGELEEFGLEVEFDSPYLTFLEVRPSDFTEDWDEFDFELVGNTVRIDASNDDAEAPDDPDVLAYVVFFVSPSASGSTTLSTTGFSGDLEGLPDCSGELRFRECSDCDGMVSELTLRYLGESPSWIEVEDYGRRIVFQGQCDPNDVFSFAGVRSDGTFGKRIKITEDGSSDTAIDTECEVPIGPGLVVDNFEVIRGASRNGGALCPLVEAAGPCNGGKPCLLTLRYTGEACDASDHDQESQTVDCEGDPRGEPLVRIRGIDEPTGDVYFEGEVSLGGLFDLEALAADRSRLQSRTVVEVYDLDDNLLHAIEFRTSCSQPLRLGDQFGAFVVEDFIHKPDCEAPPELIRLNRDALWPPNHRAVPVAVSLPIAERDGLAYVLSAVTSNEPDAEAGDGDRAGDIRGAVLGTPDLLFKLRSEQSSGEFDRVYTIVYTLFDEVGSFDVATEIRVPHCRPGTALGSHGFSESGTSFLPGADAFSIVLIGGTGFDVTHVDKGAIYLGNSAGTARPAELWIADIDGDGRDDVGLRFAVSKATEIASQSVTADGPVGLYYRFSDEAHYLVSDIFDLGPPIGTGAGAEGTRAAAPSLPTTTALTGVYPNPFEPSTTISFTLDRENDVTVDVYDARGALVRNLVQGARVAGRYEVVWDGRGRFGTRLASGVYFVRLVSGSVANIRKIVMLR